MAKKKAEETAQGPQVELSLPLADVSTNDLFEELRKRIANGKNKGGSVWLKTSLDKLKVSKYWFDKSEAN